MTAERRLAALEAALSPTELVVRWLEEAHGFGGIEAYVRSMLDDPAVVPPADQLARVAASGARASLRGKGAEAIGKAVDGAIRETIFRFELVLRINTVSHELIDRQMLLNGVFSTMRRPDTAVVVALAFAAFLVFLLIALTAPVKNRLQGSPKLTP